MAGFFGLRTGRNFSKIKNINLIQGQEIVVDHFIQLLLKNNISIKAIKLDHYFHLGTIDELNEFKFWNIIFKKIILILNPITRFFVQTASILTLALLKIFLIIETFFNKSISLTNSGDTIQNLNFKEFNILIFSLDKGNFENDQPITNS